MDGRLRDSERRAAIGDDRARTTLLLARVRAGELASADVELAAYLGDPAALAATDVRPPDGGLGAWIQGLSRWGQPTLVRAGVALGQAMLEAREALPGRPEEGTLSALEEARAWCDDPERPLWWVLETAKKAAFCSEDGIDQSLAWLATEVVAGAGSNELSEASAHVVEACELARRVLSEDQVRETVQRALRPSI